MKKSLALFLLILITASCGLIRDNDTGEKKSEEHTRKIIEHDPQDYLTSFVSNQFGFSVEHPSCETEEDQYGVTLICDEGEIVFVRQPDIPRPPVLDSIIEDVTIDSIAAKLYDDVNQKTGAEEKVIIFDIPGSEDDIYIRAEAEVDAFDTVISSFKLQSQ